MILIDTDLLLAIIGGSMQRAAFEGQTLACSAISKLAILGDASRTADELQLLDRLFNVTQIVSLDADVVANATAARQIRKGLSVHDSLIVGTAMSRDFVLWTIHPERYELLPIQIKPLQGR